MKVHVGQRSVSRMLFWCPARRSRPGSGEIGRGTPANWAVAVCLGERYGGSAIDPPRSGQRMAPRSTLTPCPRCPPHDRRRGRAWRVCWCCCTARMIRFEAFRRPTASGATRSACRRRSAPTPRSRSVAALRSVASSHVPQRRARAPRERKRRCGSGAMASGFAKSTTAAGGTATTASRTVRCGGSGTRTWAPGATRTIRASAAASDRS